MHVWISRCILEILIPIVSGKWRYQVFSEQSHHLSMTSPSLHHFLQSCPQLAHFPHLLCCGLPLLTNNLRVHYTFLRPSPQIPFLLEIQGPSFPKALGSHHQLNISSQIQEKKHTLVLQEWEASSLSELTHSRDVCSQREPGVVSVGTSFPCDF